MNNELIKKIENIGIVPVVVINDASKSEKLADSLVNGGIPCAEVTFRTSAAEESIKRIVKAHPEMIIGAGTVVTVEQAEKAIKAGAKFLVSPGYDQILVDWSKKNDVLYFPGVSTASEVQIAVSNGFCLLKFFPAEACGGVKTIKSLVGPFPQVRFMVTGGISKDNLDQYASCPSVAAIGGSWMVKSDMIENEEWDKITALCKDAVCSIQGFTFAHMGINSDSDEEVDKTVAFFSSFGMIPKKGNSSTMVNTEVEVVHFKGLGKYGHIGIRTYNIERAIYYLSTLGYKFDESSKKLDSKGKLKAIYFSDEVSGFAVHLVQ